MACCTLCQRENRDNSPCQPCEFPVGTRGQCRKSVCVNLADDGDAPHGGRCGCDCGQFLREAHFEDHIQIEGHGRPPSGCFPGVCGPVVGAAARQAGLLLSEQTYGPPIPDRVVAALNRFLNVAAPGHRALQAALPPRDGPGGEWVHDTSRWANTGVTYTAFSPAFFTKETLQRVFALALRQAVTAWAGDPTADWSRHPSSPFRLVAPHEREELLRWARSADAPAPPVPSATALTPWAAPDLAEQEGPAAGRLHDALEVSIPADASERARWLVQGVLTSTGAAMHAY